jgi:NTP pyrophosphatase (non-canonical NTP hydrolase)
MTHPDPTPREPQSDQASTRYVPPQRLTPGGPVHGGFTVTEHDTSGVPQATTLGLHLLSEHRMGNAHLLTPREQADIHAAEHAGPGTIRNHPPAARNWSLAKVHETLAEWDGAEPVACPAHGAHPHSGATCLDCPACLPAEAKLSPSLPARLVREFHEAFGLPINDTRYTTNLLRAKLVLEEAREAADAITAPLAFTAGGRADVAKELADAVITLYGTAVTMGIDLDEAVRLVHASNMTKSGVDSDGKVTKGPNYVEPNMSPAVLPIERSWRGEGSVADILPEVAQAASDAIQRAIDHKGD